MKILLLGSMGHLGWELNRTLAPHVNLIALTYPTIDMRDPKIIRTVVRTAKPDLIINATAYTNVDKAESEPELAMAINGFGPGVLAEEAKNRGAALIHYSTDYVFDGEKGSSYYEDDEANPLNVYGRTKLIGEKAVSEIGGAFLIFRTSWVYSLRRPCFVTKVLEWARKNETLRIVDDQISCPTWARSLAEATAQIISLGDNDPIGFIESKRGLYHLADSGACSRFEWAKRILELDPDKNTQIVKEVLPAKTDDFPTPAKRPKITTLNLENFIENFNLIPNSWEQNLEQLFNPTSLNNNSNIRFYKQIG